MRAQKREKTKNGSTRRKDMGETVIQGLDERNASQAMTHNITAMKQLMSLILSYVKSSLKCCKVGTAHRART